MTPTPPPTGSASPYLSTPASTSSPASTANPQPQPQPQPSAGSEQLAKSDTRLYVGNLHPSVDEYTLIQTFSKYGKIAKLDFLFHKSGPSKGKPRGYAFVEYADRHDALQAKVETHDRTLRGRRLSVTFANQSQYADAHASGAGPHRRRDADASRPTSLSLLKNASRPQGTNAKIAAMQAKLAKLRQDKDSSSSGPSSSSPGPGAKGKDTLPPKPTFSSPK